MPPTKAPKSASFNIPAAVTRVDYDASVKIANRRKSLDKLIESEMNKKSVDVRNLTRLMALDVHLARTQYGLLGNHGAAHTEARVHAAAIGMLQAGGHLTTGAAAGDGDGWDEGLIRAAEEAMQPSAPVVRMLPSAEARDDDIVDED